MIKRRLHCWLTAKECSNTIAVLCFFLASCETDADKIHDAERHAPEIDFPCRNTLNPYVREMEANKILSKGRDLNPIHTGDLIFPPDAEHLGIEGCAIVRFTLRPDGKAENIVAVVEAPGGVGFGDAVMHYVATTTYSPAITHFQFTRINFMLNR